MTGSQTTLKNINITNTSSSTYGGAIYVGATNCNIVNVNVTNANAIDGGAIYLNANYQNVANCTINNANATRYGGGLYANGLIYIYLDDITFNNSHAYNGGALYYGGSVGSLLWVRNSTFTNNIASHNGGAVYYVVIDDNGGEAVIYRDYNNFDGKGDNSTGRTTLAMESSAGSTYAKRIDRCYFKDNKDYPLTMSASSATDTILAMINMSSPLDFNGHNYRIVVNITKDDTLVSQIILDTYQDYNDHIRTTGFVISTRENLTRDTEYNVTLGFEDSDYLYKEASSSFKTADSFERGDFKILQDLIDAAISGNGVLNLERDYIFTAVEDWQGKVNDPDDWCMNITDTITINGNGNSIDALGYARIFNITGANVVLNDLRFINGNTSGIYNDAILHQGKTKAYGDGVKKGGAIFWAGANGVINRSTISNNYAEYGAGIYFNSTAANCNVTNDLFIYNDATKNGGAIDCNATKMRLYNTTFEFNRAENGSALCREVSATSGSGRNNTFISNHATNAGAALAWMRAENIYIDTYTFIDNTADYSGGAIYVGVDSTNCTVFNCTFTGNNVTNSFDGHGGAIEWYADTGRVLNSTFVNNNAYTGGAIYVGSASGNINITNSGFLKNNAITSGGAIDLAASSVRVNNSYFRQNTAEQGGAIFVGGSADNGNNNFIYSSYFTDNNATGHGGAVNWNSTAGQIIKTNFTSNSAEYGGAVYIGGASPNSRMEDVIFTSNNATKNGGAIDWNATGGQIYNLQFISNYAGEYGAALCRENGATGGSGKNNTFKYNHADIAGAALAWINVTGIHIVDYKFYYNTANASGGAIFIGNGSDNCIIDESIFVGNNITNETGGHGGAIDVVANNASVINSNFTDNNAFYGGAVFVGSQSGHTNITNARFTKNNAAIDGGAINLQASGVTMNKTYFDTNTAVHNGGAVYVGGAGTTNRIYTSNFTNNRADNDGGAIYWRAYAGHIEYTNFTSNYAQNGGAIYLNGVSNNTNITHVIFKDNHATTGNGGAIDCNSTKMNLTYTSFEDNYAKQYGAALCREQGATNGSGHHNNFTSNHADIAGAALAWLNVKNININYYNFIDNTADVKGGAIYATVGSDNFTINNCNFEGNNVTGASLGSGGAIDIASDNNTIKNSNFTNNHAFEGGAIYVEDTTAGHTNITNVTFSKNGAYEDGGAINIEASGVDLNDTRFYNNTAGRNGGAVYVGGTGTSNVVYYSRFVDNEAAGYGGAIDWRASAGEIFNTNFVRNTAEYGGAIYLNGISSGSKISEVYFGENTARKNGGAIDCNATLMNLTHTMFVSNIAQYGAALCRESGATGGFGMNNTFDKNHAYISGAALAWLGVDNIKINNYTFTNNTADFSGGAIYVNPESDNCQVYNSTFKDNYVSNAITGRGGAIDWLGNNGTVQNTTFTKCVSVNGGGIYVGEDSDNMTVKNVTFIECESLTNGGAIVLYGDNATITDSNFTACSGQDYGGAIAAFNSNNGNLTNNYFKYNAVGIHISPQGDLYGEGGAIYWTNSTNLRVADSKFISNRAHLSGGSISADNCNDSVVYNITTHDETAFENGGSISWINSDNVTIEKGKFNDSGANYFGGSIYLSNINATVKNSLINYTWASWDVGGGMYVDGNVVIDNVTFNDTHSDDDNATAIYFESGTSKVVNSTFTNSINSIGIAKGANVTLTENNLTADDPNKLTVMYIEENTTDAASIIKYAVWNEGDLYLEKNNFDYVIFNDGTIWTPTTTKMLNGEEHEVDWNETFVFFANITDDNLNTIISVNSLYATNDVYQDVGGRYLLPYNADRIRCIYQGVFHLKPIDENLKQNTQINGTLKVKMPVSLEFEEVIVTPDSINITAKLSPKVESNFTVYNQNLTFKIGDKTYNATILSINNQTKYGGKFITWTIANATKLLKNNFTAGNYMVTGIYAGDDVHKAVENITSFNVALRLPYLEILINNIYWGQNATIRVNTNGTGQVLIFVNGRAQFVDINETGNATLNVTGLEPGRYSAVVTYPGDGGRYFMSYGRGASFNVYKLNTTIEATPTTPPISVDGVEIITVDVNQTAGGFAKVTIDGTDYYAIVEQGHATFAIPNLAKKVYTDIDVTYLGDTHFNENSTKISFEVVSTDDYNITVKVDNVTYGQNATIYIVLPISVSQNLTVYVNNTKYENVTVKDGLAIVNVNTTVLDTPGQYVVNVTYPGDDIYALKYNNGTKFNVFATDDWTLGLNVEAYSYGENTIFTVTVQGNVQTRTVNLTIDGKYHPVAIDSNGVGALTLNNLTGGMHTAVANYTGDSRYLTKTNSTNFLVEQALSSTTLTQEVDGDVIATVTPTGVTGSVTFYVNGREYTVDLVGNVATLDKNNITIGNNSIIAIYSGDINFTSSKDSKNITIAKNEALVNVTATNVTYGKASEIVVQVPAAQKGYVTITVNDTLVNVTVKIENGVAKFNATGLDVGRYIVNVTYLGDETYDIAQNHTYFNVTKNTNLAVEVIAQNVTVKENASFVINVSDDFKGKVNITIDGVSYYDDIAKALVSIDKLPAGSYTANVTFYGDDNYNNKSVMVDFTVSRVTPTINVTIDDVTYPDKSIAVVDISDYANGTVNITVDGKYFNKTITNGHVEIDITGLTAGVKDAVVNFTTSDDYNTNLTANVKFNIKKANSTVIITQDGQNVTATVTTNATGNVTFYINGKKYTKEVNDQYQAILTEVLRNGNNTVVVIYSGDANFTSAFNATNNTVDLKDAKVNVTATNVTYGNVSVITVKVPTEQKGYVRVVVNGTEIDVVLEIKDGVATFNATDLNAGIYEVNVTYLGDGTYGIKENSTLFNISKADLTASVIAQNVTVDENASFILSVLNDFNGNVSIEVDGVNYNGTVKTFVEIEKLLKGPKQATVTFYGDDNYNIKVLEPTFTVSAAEPTINVTITDTTYPNSATATVKVSGKANGTIEIKVDDKIYTRDITNGEVVIELDGLNAGLKEANVTFTSTDDYNTNANATYKFFIKKAQSHIKINVTPENLYSGDDAIINITVSCTGTPIIYLDDEIIDDKEMENNRIIIDKSKLTVGKHTVVVYYPGDENYESSSEAYTFNVDKHEAEVNVTAENTPYNKVAQITVQVPKAQTGYVTITVGDKNYTAKLAGGEAKFNITGLEVAKYTVNVTYEGDENYTVQTNDTTFNVTQINLKPTVLGVNVTDAMNSTFIILVPDDYEGQVTITVDGETYTGDANSIVQMAKLTVGEKTAHVVFSDDTNYKGTELDVTFNVTKAEKALPVTTVVNSTTVVVTVPENVTGNVTVVLPNGTNKTVIVENGSVIIPLENMTPGVNNITVIYTDGNNTVTTNATVTVPKYDTTIDVEVSEAVAGGNATVTVTVPVNATGVITVTVDGKTYTTDNITDGKAVLTIENLTAGDKTLIVEYGGNANYSANYTLENFTVTPGKAESEIIVVDHGNGTVVVVIGDNATGNVTIKVGDKEFNATVINGTAIVNMTNVTPGSHEIEVIYSGDGNHTNATANATIIAPKYDTLMNVTVGEAKEGEPFNITVEVPVGATGEVIVYVGGENHTVEIDPETGKAIVTVEDIAPGDHTVAVEYTGDGNYSANYTVSNMTVEKAKAESDLTVVDYGNGTVVVVVGDNATGNVTIKVGDNEYNATVINGTAIVTVDNELPGSHEIEVIYSGDGNHNATSKDTNITIPKYDTEMSVTVGEAKEGEPITITVEVPVGATGEVIVYVGGENHTATIDPTTGKATVTVDNVAPGNHTVVVEYGGDANYTANYTVSNMTVDALIVTPDINVIDYVNGTVMVIVGDNATGNVTIKVGDNEYNATVINGTAIVSVDNETPGSHEVEVIYSGDDNHNATSKDANITIPKYETQMNVTVSEVKEGETAVVTVKVPSNATGNVTVYIDGQNYTAEIKDDGTAVVEVENITGGPKTVTVVYSGDENYIGDYTIYEFVVEKEKTTPNVVVEKDNNIVVVYIGDNATGNVTVKVGNDTYNATVVNGTAVITLENVTPGIHDIEVIYSGDENYTNITVNTNINISKHETPIKINVEDINVGDKTIITVEVPEKATGGVVIEIDGEKYSENIVNGVARFEVENLIAGNKSVSAVYEGDSNYAANFTTGQFKVLKVNSNLTVEIKDAKVGENITVTVHVPKDATGQVLIDIDGVGYYVNVTGGSGTVEIPYLPNGTYEVNLTYTGDDKYLSSTNRSTVTLSKLESFVIPIAHNIKVGENEIIKLRVPVGATGTVTVVIDTEEYVFNLQNGALGATYKAGEKYAVAISGGNGELVISGLPKGEYTVSVKYNGDEKYLPAVNTTIFTVSKQDTSMEVIDQANGTIKVVLPEDATGNVTVSDGNNTYTVEVIDGTATIDLDKTAPGKHDIEVKYSGDSDYSSNKTTVSVEIPKYETPISVETHDICVGETETVVVTLSEGATGTVTIEINGKEYTTSEIIDGKATFNVDGLAFGNKTVAVKYSGDDRYHDNYTTGQFTVSKVPSTVKASGKDINVGKDETITATVPDDATGRVLVDIDGVGYYGDIINGKAKIIIPELPSGKYTVSVSYEGDEKYLSSTTQVKFTVSKVKAPISATGDEIQPGEDATVIVKLPSDATGTVTITVDGKKYTTEVKDGKAIFVVPGLTKGDYDVDAYYSGDKKYDANDTITDIEVYFNETYGDGEKTHQPVGGECVSLANYATGNPIMVLLFMLLVIGSAQLRRFKH